MSEQDPQAAVTLEEMITFRDELRSRREQLLNSEDGQDPLQVVLIDSLIQALDTLIENTASALSRSQDTADPAQYQELLAKTMFKVQQDPLEALAVPAPPVPGGPKKSH